MSSSPIHVHVQDNIPLHVHVKKPTRLNNVSTAVVPIKSARGAPRARKKAIVDPWIPAPGKTSMRDRNDKQMKWESGKSQLEMNAPLKTSDLHNGDPDNKIREQLTEYEQKIEDLMSEVGTLKNEMELTKVEQELGEKHLELEASRVALEEKQKELNFVARECEVTEKENARLRRSVEKYQVDHLNLSMENAGLPKGGDEVLRQLVDVEVAGIEAAKQVAALRDVVTRLRYEKRLASSDITLLNQQRDLLLQTFDKFENSNRDTRRLLQVEHKRLTDVTRLEEQRDILIRKLSDADSATIRLKSDLMKKTNDVEQLADQIAEEKKHSRTLNELNKSVDATRAHLQRELRARESDNSRLHVQLKNMEKDTEAMQREASDLIGAAKLEREQMAGEKDAMKKQIRSHRSRAEKAEEQVRAVRSRAEERERKLEDARAQADSWRERYARVSEDKALQDERVEQLSKKVGEVEAMLRNTERLARNKESDMFDKVEKLVAELAACRQCADRSRDEATAADHKKQEAMREAEGLREDLKKQEKLSKELEEQLRKAKSETEEALLTAERVDRDSRRVREDGSNEIERVKEQMLDRMRDLQPLPEILRETEMRLRDAQDKLHVYEQRAAEQSRIIAELTNKAEDRTDEAATLRQKLSAMSDANRALEAKTEILHARLDDRDHRVKEVALDSVSRDEKIQQLKLKLDETAHERDSFKRQLENAVGDLRKAVDNERDSAAAREHVAQARIVDLETQLTRTKTDVASIKRSKEDSERRCQSKMQDIRDRLEQAESTNRSMRNYVNFLKSSYRNVFGAAHDDLTSTPVRQPHYRPSSSSPASPY